MLPILEEGMAWQRCCCQGRRRKKGGRHSNPLSRPRRTPVHLVPPHAKKKEPQEKEKATKEKKAGRHRVESALFPRGKGPRLGRKPKGEKAMQPIRERAEELSRREKAPQAEPERKGPKGGKGGGEGAPPVTIQGKEKGRCYYLVQEESNIGVRRETLERKQKEGGKIPAIAETRRSFTQKRRVAQKRKASSTTRSGPGRRKCRKKKEKESPSLAPTGTSLSSNRSKNPPGGREK